MYICIKSPTCQNSYAKIEKLVIKIYYVYYLEKQSNGKNLTPGGQVVRNGTYVMSPSVVIYGQTD